MKKNAVYEVMDEVFSQTLNGKEPSVFREEHIHLNYKEDEPEKKPSELF